MDFQAFVVELLSIVDSVSDGLVIEHEEEVLQVVKGHSHLGAMQPGAQLKGFSHGHVTLVVGAIPFLKDPSHQSSGLPISAIPVQLGSVVDDTIIFFWACVWGSK